MLTVKSVAPAYLHTVDIFELPEHMRRWARDWSNNNSDSMLDYMDGDFKMLLDFTDMGDDLTPDDVVQTFIDTDRPDEEYPYPAWAEERDDLEEYIELKRWKDITRYISQNISPSLVAENKVALSIWH